MAHDLLTGRNGRDFSRGTSPAVTAGEKLIIERRSGPGFFAWTAAILVGTRVLTGKWPWYWFSRLDEKL